MVGSLTDENIIEEKFKRYESLKDTGLSALVNHQFFASQNKLTNILNETLERRPK